MTRILESALRRANRLMRPAKLSKAARSVQKMMAGLMLASLPVPPKPKTTKPRKVAHKVGQSLGTVMKQLRAVQSLMPGAVDRSKARTTAPSIPKGAQYLSRTHRSAAGTRGYKLYPTRPTGASVMKITTFSELTIDGRMTLGHGLSSKALFDFYGVELRRWFHGERAAHDAIMVGAGTVRADNPELTVRHVIGRNPLRVIPTNDGNIPAGSHILNDGHPTLFAVPRNLPDAVRNRLAAHRGVNLMDCGETAVDLKEVANGLSARGVGSLLVEGGSRLLHGLFAAGLVNRIVIKHIPVISGALDAPTYLAADAGSPVVALSRWQVVDWRLIGGVGVSIYEPLKGTPE